MPAYNRINDWLAPAIRKLSDYHIFTQGKKSECTRLTKITDRWGNADSETISVSQIQAIFVFPPGEMPLIRLRAGKGTQAQVQSTGLYFYDLLPVEIYVRWQDKIEVNDVLYFWAGDENGNKIPVVFKILDQKGAVSSQLIWRKMIAAPITNIDQEIPPDLAERLIVMLNEPPVPWRFDLQGGELVLHGDSIPASFVLSAEGELTVEDSDLPVGYDNWRVSDGQLMAEG